MEIIEKTVQDGSKGNISAVSAGLTKRQRQFVPLYLELKNVCAACRAFGIDRKTFYAWMKNPVFADELDRLQTEQVTEALAIIKLHTETAAQVLASLMSSADEAIKLKASKGLLDYYQQNIESAALDRRLQALEESLNAGAHNV